MKSIARTTPQREAITAKLSPLTARIKRGIELFASKGEQIAWVDTDRAKVPSCRHAGRTYLVVLHTDYETCNCVDREGAELGCCKHIAAALISHARRVFYRVDKFGPPQARSYALIETRAGVDRVILRSASCADVYHAKWALENPGRSSRAAKNTRICRVCGGYGQFLWGAQNHGDCSYCGGTGRAA